VTKLMNVKGTSTKRLWFSSTFLS